ncbi:MAG TPA: MFS transporter, partial [Candidatus Binatia bacterium]
MLSRIMPRPLSLSAFWFIYMGALGIFFPYFSLYLSENAGLSGTQVGLVLAVIPLIAIVAQPLWGQVADRTGARRRVLAYLAAGTCLGYVLLAGAVGFPFIVAATAFLAAFETGVLPTTMSVSFAVLRDAGPHAYGFVRVWGTVGFFLLVLSFPSLLERYQEARDLVPEAGGPSQPGLEIMFLVSAGLVLLASLISLRLPREGAISLRAARGDWRALLKNRTFLRFLVFSFAAYVLMHGPIWLFPVFIRSRGGDLDTIRGMWILMLAVEIPLMLSTGSGLKGLGARGLLAVGILASGLRWTLCAAVSDPFWLYPIQVLHGVTVVGVLVGGPLYLDAVSPERLRSTA